MMVRDSLLSIARTLSLNPRTPARAPTPIATANMTNRNFVSEERVSRQAMRPAVRSESLMPACTFAKFVGDDQAVAHGDDAVGARRQGDIVGHQHQRGPFALVERDEQIEHVRPVDAVEVAGGLVGHQDGRLHHERARQRHALLFAAGKLDRVVIQAIAQAHAFEQGTGPGDSRGDVAAGKLVRQQDVFFGGQGREQLVALENESDLAAADQRQLVFAQAR